MENILFFLLFCISHTIEIFASGIDNLNCSPLPISIINGCTTYGRTAYNSINPSVVHHGTACNVTCPSSGEITVTTCQNGKWDGLPKLCIPQGHVPLLRPRRATEQEQMMQMLSQMSAADMNKLQKMFQGRTAPPMDMNGPVLTCPPSMHEYADDMQVTTRVKWEEPTAIDAEDGQLKPKRYGAGPGWTFAEGTKTIVYLARDSGGNLGQCDLNITVEVVRCRPGSKKDIPNGYYSCQPSPEFMYGANCQYGCYQGYELVGEKHLQCEKSGKWSHDVPKCKSLTCPMLRPFKLGYFKCTSRNNYKSMCTYTCKKGYVIKSGMSRVRVCVADKKWRGDEPVCEDMEPPRFTYCPASVTAVVEKGGNSAVVTWDWPTVKDNSLEDITPTVVSEVKNNTEVKIGVYDVIYEAKDKAGNKAKPCRFKVIVKELSCPVQHALPFMKVSCPKGTSLGATCAFSCDKGYQLNGTENTECIKSKTIPPYASWDWSKGRPLCSAIEPCPKPEPPINGALACDLWENGRFCQMQCMKGTDIPPSFTAWKLFVCSDGGKWNFNGKIPACEKTKKATSTVMSVSMHYYEGKCPDPKVKEKIRKNFIAALHDTPFTETWKKSDCKPQNVKVVCGKIRQKRSADKNKRVKIEMKVDIENTIPAGLDTANAMENMKQNAGEILNLMKSDVKGDKSKLLPLNLVPNRTVEVETEGVQLHCPRGLFPSYRSYSCVGCTKGTFYNDVTSKCVKCQRGKFQPLSEQHECVTCPLGQTTPFTGSTSEEDCKDECEPGTFSADGTAPCQPCDVGHFQPTKGCNSCNQCPGGTSTMLQGSTNAKDCEDFGLTISQDGSAEIEEQLSNEELTQYVMTFWMKISNDGPSRIFSMTSLQDLQCHVDAGNVICKSNMHSLTLKVSRDHWIHFRVTMTSNSLAVSMNGGTPASTGTEGNSTVMANSLDLKLGGSGFEGEFYQVNVWSKDRAPVVTKTPTCDHQTTGDILSWAVLARARLVNASVGASSTCDDTDECASNPCMHGACVDGLKSYHCECEDGYEATTCNVNIDECQHHMCEHGGTCNDGVASYTCTCLAGYTGDLCQDVVTDGNWAEWGAWGACSKECGGGTKTRGRRCDYPAPNNGGKQCDGEKKEEEPCNTDKCPECAKLIAPPHGKLKCEEGGGLQRCHVTCNTGFAFESTPRDTYVCGESTGHEWNFRSDGPVKTSLPRCIKVQTPKEMQITFTAAYADLICQDNHDDVISAVSKVANEGADILLCKKLSQCEIKKVKVNNCQLRERRDTLKNSVSFSITISTTPETGESSNMRQLNAAYVQLSNAVKEGKFNVFVGGKQFRLDGQPRLDAEVTCEAGHTRVDAHCIPCASGTFYHDGYCEKCESGSYQPQEKQSTCEPCPSGTTTDGRGAISAAECSVTCEPGHYMKDKLCEKCRVGEFQDQRGQMACKQCPLGHITPYQGALSEKDCIDPNKTPVADSEAQLDQEGGQFLPLPQDTSLHLRSNVNIIIGGVVITCLCVMAMSLVIVKVRYNRYNKIHVTDMKSHLQAIARASTLIAFPITGIQPNLAITPPHKKDI